MIDIHEKYTAAMFVNAADITPSPDNVTTLVNIFRDKECIPGTFQEISNASPSPQPRLRFSSPGNEWTISFATHRIDIEKNPLDPKGQNLGDLERFCDDALLLFSRIFEKYNKKSNRLALISNYFLEDMNRARLEKAYANLFKSSRYYAANIPVEWNWRTVSKDKLELLGNTEEINVVTMINRLKGEFLHDMKPFDRIQISLDLNTIAENAEYRFDLSHAQAFFKVISKNHKLLVTEITEFINA